MNHGSDQTDSQILNTRFPGYAWMPRWTRRYWTPATAASLALAIFSAGTWFDNWRHRDSMREAAAEIKAETAAARKAIHDDTAELVRKSDIAVMTSHVEDLWKMRIDIDAELARQQAKKTAVAKRR